MKKLLLSCLLFLGMVLNAQITLGGGSTTKGKLPVDSYYGYTYSQQIIKKSEINANAAGNITGLTFYLSSTATLTHTADWVVYLGLTSKDKFDGTSDWIPVSALTQVFAGTVTNNAGQVTITFATPFPYDNASNLVIATDENTSGYDGSTDRFYVYPVGADMSLAFVDDGVNTDPATPGSGTLFSVRSVVALQGLTIAPVPTCPTVSSPTNGTTTFAVNGAFTWTAISNATGYKVSLGTTPGGTQIMNNVDVGNVTTYTPATPLNYGTTYYLTVNAYNATAVSSGCSEISFTTKSMPCPTVDMPANAANGVSTTPTISWAAVTGATGYKISVGTTSGGTDVVNNANLGNVTSYTFSTPLLTATTYYYTVTAYNGYTQSVNCAERTFNTMCNATNTPWSENFDSMTTVGDSTSTSVLPPCWTSTAGGLDYIFTTSNAASNTYNDPQSGPNYLTIYWPYEESSYVWTPALNLTAGVSYTFTFDWVGDGTSGWDAEVLVNNLPSETGATTLGTFVTNSVTTGQTYQTQTYTFTPATTGTYNFGISAEATGFAPYYLGFDNFSVHQTNLATAEVVKEKVMVYPNPFRDILNISDVKDVKTVLVSDASGRLVTTIESPRNQMDLSSLPSGMYVVTMVHKDGSKTSVKVLKK